MVSRAIIFAFAFAAAVSADVSELLTDPPLPSAPILIDGGQNFDDVPYGVNPFGKNANQRPLARPSSPIMAPIVAAPRIAAQPRALVPQQSMLQLPRSFQTASQPFRPQPIRAAQPQPQQLRTLPIIDRSQLNEKNAQILRQDQEVNPDGSYNFSFETDNGIARSETGTPKVLGGNPPVVAEQVTGSYSYTENGVQYKVTYIADENGFRAFGDHLPTPPPTPPHVLQTLELLAKLQ